MKPTDDKARPGSTASDLEGKVKRDAEDFKETAAEQVDQAKDEAKARAEREQARGAGAARDVSSALEAAADALSDQDRESLANYTRQVSDSISGFADRLQSKSVDELAQDVRRLARENPNAFTMGSIALGFGLSRFLKASQHRDPEDRTATHRQSDSDTRPYGTTAEQREPGAGTTTPATGAGQRTSPTPQQPGSGNRTTPGGRQ